MNRFEAIAIYKRLFNLSWSESVKMVDDIFGFKKETKSMGY